MAILDRDDKYDADGMRNHYGEQCQYIAQRLCQEGRCYDCEVRLIAQRGKAAEVTRLEEMWDKEALNGAS